MSFSLVAVAAGCALVLQGCGKPATTTTMTTTTTTAATTTTATTTTTTTFNKHQVPPREAQEVAKLMNEQYHSFDPSNPNSGKGVFLRATEEWAVYCNYKCFEGQPDCRISGSIFNDKMLLTRQNTMALSFGKRTAWYVNQTVIDEVLGKCSFVWDGGTQGKYNHGCGSNPGFQTCNDTRSPFYNLDPDTNYTKENTGTSRVVADTACENMDQSKWPTSWGHGPDCFWKGVAYYPPGGKSTDDTWQMLKWRFDHQDYAPMAEGKDPRAFWNEMIIDGEELLQELSTHAAEVVPAFVYDKSKTGARDQAKLMADAMAKEYGLSKAVPLVAFDSSVNVVQGGDPFQAIPGDNDEMIAV